MKIGPLTLRLVPSKDGTWCYEIWKDEQLIHHGYRPHEHQARDAGLEDANLMRSYAHAF